MLDFGVTYPTIKPRQLYSKLVSPWSEECLGGSLASQNLTFGTTDFAWTIGQAIGVPFHVSQPGQTLVAGWCRCGSGAGNNFDVGITTLAGVVLASTGSKARTASTQVSQNMLASYVLPLGDYYMTLAGDTTSNMAGGAPAAGICEAEGLVIAASAFPLAGKTLSWAVTTLAFMPCFGFTLRTVSP